jgi:DNA-binding NtrC family response regulator
LRNHDVTILLVDDDDAIRRVIEYHLASSGYDVVSVPDTVVALDQLTWHPEIDLCLVDLVMPFDVPDGVAFARSIRRQKQGMPLIPMTGHYSASERHGELIGSLIYKPVALDKLVAEIQRLLTP